MESSVTLREDPARTVAYLRGKGPYAQIPGAIQQLMGYLKRCRLTPAGPPTGVFFTDPRKVPDGEARWEIQMPIAEHNPSCEPEAEGAGIRTLEARTVAVVLHTGPYDAVGPAYAHAERWIGEHSLTIAGAPEEAYLSEPDTPPERTRTEIRFPVAHAPVPLAK